jgi:hypothetical protein
VQHFSTSAGAMFSSVILSTGDAGELVGMPRLGGIAMAVAALVPALFWLVERRVGRLPAVSTLPVAA